MDEVNLDQCILVQMKSNQPGYFLVGNGLLMYSRLAIFRVEIGCLNFLD